MTSAFSKLFSEVPRQGQSPAPSWPARLVAPLARGPVQRPREPGPGRAVDDLKRGERVARESHLEYSVLFLELLEVELDVCIRIRIHSNSSEFVRMRSNSSFEFVVRIHSNSFEFIRIHSNSSNSNSVKLLRGENYYGREGWSRTPGGVQRINLISGSAWFNRWCSLADVVDVRQGIQIKKKNGYFNQINI